MDPLEKTAAQLIGQHSTSCSKKKEVACTRSHPPPSVTPLGGDDEGRRREEGGGSEARDERLQGGESYTGKVAITIE